ncbi:MAG: hypothetical protein QM654_07140 [Dysgonamonadaceae bacterium]
MDNDCRDARPCVLKQQHVQDEQQDKIQSGCLCGFSRVRDCSGQQARRNGAQDASGKPDPELAQGHAQKRKKKEEKNRFRTEWRSVLSSFFVLSLDTEFEGKRIVTLKKEGINVLFKTDEYRQTASGKSRAE